MELEESKKKRRPVILNISDDIVAVNVGKHKCRQNMFKVYSWVKGAKYPDIIGV